MSLPPSATGTVVNERETTTTTTDYVTRHKVTASDPYLIERIVGYHEYGRALHYFDLLASKCDRYEMEAVDEIVRSEPEFAFYTVSSEQVGDRKAAVAKAESDRRASDRRTSERNAANSAAIESNRKRHGFRWISALARAEVGAMRAGFSQNPRPYTRTPGYDANEYRTLLSESARLHFWSLNRDPVFVALSKQFRPTSVTLSYLRRLNIATGFSLASVIATHNIDPRTTREMGNYAQRLSSTRDAIQLKIASYLATPEINSQTNTKTRQMSRIAEMCLSGTCWQFDKSMVASGKTVRE